MLFFTLLFDLCLALGQSSHTPEKSPVCCGRKERALFLNHSNSILVKIKKRETATVSRVAKLRSMVGPGHSVSLPVSAKF